ncbi:MAG: hypothetical protein ABIA67_01940 [Candidatus Margulisiibacteriota bacterium]
MKHPIIRELLIFLSSFLFGITLFPYIFGFFYLLAIGRLSDFPELFVHWDGFFKDLARGEPNMWGVALLPYILVQLARVIVWVVKKRG